MGPTVTTNTGATGASTLPPVLYGMWGQYAPEATPNPYGPLTDAWMQYQNWQQLYANQSTGLQQQSLGLNMQSNQIDQSANAAEGTIIDQLKGLAGQDYANVLAGYGIDRTEAGQRRERDRFDEDNRATAGGVTLFPAHGRNIGDIEAAYTNTAGRIGLGEKGAGITHQQTLLGLDRQKLQNSTQAEKLDLMAAQYGIDGQQLSLGLQNTLAGMGYQGAQQLATLTEQAGSHDAAQAQQALQALSQLYAMGASMGMFGGAR